VRPDVLLVGDGSSIHLRRLAAGLAQQNLQVELAGFEGDPVGELPFHRLGDLPARIDARYALAIPRLASVIRRRRPRVVNAHYVTSFGVMSALALWLAHPTGARPPLIQTAWGDDLLVTPQRSRFMRRLVTFALRSAALMTGDAQELRNVASGFAPRTPTASFVFGPPESLLQRHEQKAHVIVSARHLLPEMRVDLVIRSFLHAQAASPALADWSLVVVGDGPERGFLEQLAAEGSNVEFRGAIDHGTLHDLLLRASVSVSVPVSDGTSATLLESLAAAAVPVVNDLPANLEWVDGGTAVIVGRNPTVDELSQGIVSAGEGDWDVRRLQAKVSAVTWESQVGGFADILRGLALEAARS